MQLSFIRAIVATLAIAGGLAGCGGSGKSSSSSPPPSSSSSSGGGTTSNPLPSLASISPTSANVGDGAFTLTVNGLYFTAGSVVNWGGSPRATTFVNVTQLTAQISAADIA